MVSSKRGLERVLVAPAFRQRLDVGDHDAHPIGEQTCHRDIDVRLHGEPVQEEEVNDDSITDGDGTQGLPSGRVH